MVQHQLHKPKHLSLETQASGSHPHFARFASETVNKVTTSDQTMEPATGAGPSPTRTNPASLILAFFFSSKNFLGQREKSQEPSVYQASFYQICVKEQRGKIMGAKLHKQHLHFVWSQKRQPPHLPPTQALPSPNSTLGKEGTAHLQGVSPGALAGHAMCTRTRSHHGGRGPPRHPTTHTEHTRGTARGPTLPRRG